MKRGFVVAVGGAAIVIAGLAGCSSDDKQSMGEGSAKVTIDGAEKKVEGTVVCQEGAQVGVGNMADANNVAVGQFTGTEPQQVVIKVDGQNLVAQKGNPMTGGDLKMTVDGKKYTFTGKAMDSTMPMNTQTKNFTLEITCP